MNFDILGKDIAVLFILAVIFGIATYFYVLHKGKKEKRTASTIELSPFEYPNNSISQLYLTKQLRVKQKS